MKRLCYLALGALYVLHNDVWLWSDGRTLFWLPIGLTYHLWFCVVVVLVMAAAVRWAWPEAVDKD